VGVRYRHRTDGVRSTTLWVPAGSEIGAMRALLTHLQTAEAGIAAHEGGDMERRSPE
jgi:hypothetical protein